MPESGASLTVALARFIYTCIEYVLYELARAIRGLVIRPALFLLNTVTKLVVGGGWTVSLRLSLMNIEIIVVVVALLVAHIVKTKYLSRYKQLKNVEPLEKDDGFDLNPKLQVGPSASQNLNNFLDEFLSAIKIFGYLEKPVFHELARHLQTKRMIAGSTLDLTTDKSFYIVMDGSMQMYTKTSVSPADEEHSASYEDEELNGYELLNHVRTGGILSSLFTILNLFTEDIPMYYDDYAKGSDDIDAAGDEDEVSTQTSSSQITEQSSHALTEDALSSLNEETADLADKTIEQEPETRSLLSSDVSPKTIIAENQTGAGQYQPTWGTPDHGDSASTFGSPDLTETGDAPAQVPLDPSAGQGEPSLMQRISAESSQARTREFLQDQEKHGPKKNPRVKSEAAQQRENIQKRRQLWEKELAQHQTLSIARAAEDTTLAVIPSDAFIRLRQKYPNSSAHIVQVILTRLQRVTFLTAHKFLGLTREVLRTEKSMNELVLYPLDEMFWKNGAIDYIQSRLLAAQEDSDEDFFDAEGRNEVPFLQRRASSQMPAPKFEWARHLDSRVAMESELRAAVLHSMSKAIGLVSPASMDTSTVNGAPNSEYAPSTTGFRSASSSRGQGGPFSSSYGSLSLLSRAIADDESTASSSHADDTSASEANLSEMENDVHMLVYRQGTTLVSENDMHSGLFYVIDGLLEVTMTESKEGFKKQDDEDMPGDFPTKPVDDKPPKVLPLFTVGPGGIAGYLSALSGSASYVSVTAKTDVFVGYLAQNALEKIMDRQPIVLLTLAKRLMGLVSPLIRQIDSALEWMLVPAGNVIYNKGDESDSLYIIVNGRVRAIDETSDGRVHIFGEYGQGDTVGEEDCIIGAKRSVTLHAIRDSELARMPIMLFNAIAVHHPLVRIQILKNMAARVAQMRVLNNPLNKYQTARKPNLNLKTVTLLPCTSNVSVAEFANRLHASLDDIGANAVQLDQARVLSKLGRHAFSRMGSLKLAGWLAEMEQHFRIVIYVCDAQVSSPWTQTCIQQADCIFIVADASSPTTSSSDIPDSHALGEYEKLMVSMKITARKELVLVHPSRSVVSGSTRPWLKARPWLHAHHHVELDRRYILVDGGLRTGHHMPRSAQSSTSLFMPDLQTLMFNKMRDSVKTTLKKYKPEPKLAKPQVPATNDFHRLARRLCGQSIGIVLSGGGARGIAHLGVLQQLQERGIPVDAVGGTSMGAFVGGLFAREGDLVSAYGKTKKFTGRMTSVWRILSDLTYPVVAYTTGHEFNRGIFKAYDSAQIEDFWIPFFCNTTNITHSRMDVHTSGYAWRYVRSSMTLVGLLPPLSDNGDLLVDGGYMDNLPVPVMAAMGVRHILAVDVGAIDDTSPRNYSDSVSGWWVLLNRWNPWSSARNVPSLTEVQSRLTYVSSVKTLEEAKVTPGSLYMRMDVTHVGMMEFKQFNFIFDLSVENAASKLDDFASKGRLPRGYLPVARAGVSTTPVIGRRQRRYSI